VHKTATESTRKCTGIATE